MEEVVDGTGLSTDEIDGAVTRLLDAVEGVDDDGWYPALDVVRPWSGHNPYISGEFARPRAVRRYLQRELADGLPSQEVRSPDEPLFGVE